MKVGEIAVSVPRLKSIEPYPAGLAPTPSELREKREIESALAVLKPPALELPNRGLTIVFDREAGRSLVQIVDRNSGEVIEQIPGKDVIERAKYYRDLKIADSGSDLPNVER